MARPPAADRRPTLSRRRLRKAVLIGAAAILAVWVTCAIAWPVLAPQSPSAQDPDAILRAPERGHPLGTDAFGRDVLSRVMAGAREVLVIAPLAVLIAVTLGTILGLGLAFTGGVADRFGSRALEGVALLPPILPAILAVALIGRSATVEVAILAVAFTPLVAWTVRAAARQELHKPYVEAARLQGERWWYVSGGEVLPNIVDPILVEVANRLAACVFALATLSFVGLGAPPGSPDWGTQVAENRVYVQTAWWTVVAPAGAVVSLIVAVALLADALRERAE
jgi:peptide/nickel transport system permease protein